MRWICENIWNSYPDKLRQIRMYLYTCVSQLFQATTSTSTYFNFRFPEGGPPKTWKAVDLHHKHKELCGSPSQENVQLRICLTWALGAADLRYKDTKSCGSASWQRFIISPGEPFKLFWGQNVKGQGYKEQKSNAVVGICTLVNAGFFQFCFILCKCKYYKAKRSL